ncbi:ATP-binding protein [Amycolatopsis pigmentata]|uniref:ATP-binding protein n=1 Tax=Amycolatopsis pigmentata TaxID=450801 RepID=A0ABW5FTZ9_9PSEU
MSTWRESVPVAGSVILTPDARALDSLGRNHSLPTALADLVDNSIDAQASEVLIRFVRQSGRLRALYVVDNGRGIGPQEIDAAMTVGARRDYGQGDLGRFGVGMKSASFSQARSVTVISKTRSVPPVGRRWVIDSARRDFSCDVIPVAFCVEEFDRTWRIPETGSGTVVRLDQVSGFPATDDSVRVEKFVTRKILEIRQHLGLVLHRILEANRVRIVLDVEDVDSPYPGPSFDVEPINPFGYIRSGHSDYPKHLVATSENQKIVLRCHIWPGRSRTLQFRLGDSPSAHQGLYIYRNDRLLHAGGDWGGLHATDADLQLARVAVDIDNDIAGLFRMNPEKSRVTTGPEFAALAETAIAEDGTQFADYLIEAEAVYRRSRQRTRSRRTMIPPGKGFGPGLRASIEDEIPLLDREDGISIKWRRFHRDDFFQVDRESRTLWLNDAYRPEPKGERHSVNDAPLLKALLYLLVEDVFQGEYLGPKDKDNIELWREILTAAAKEQSSARD